MYYCKDFYSLSVLSLYEGELLGVVDKLYFDRKLKKLCELEMVGADGAKLRLNTKNIYNVGKNAITIKNNQLVQISNEEKDYCLAPINSKAYSIQGEFLGVVQELAFDEKFFTQKVLLDNGEILDVNNITTTGKNTLIFNKQQTKVSTKLFTPKSPRNFKRKNVKIVSTQPVEEKQEEKVKSFPIIEKKQNENLLLGRICTKDIVNFNNELLIKAYSVVNKKNLKEINKYGKIRELMLFLK